jgi:hypothetical protein
VCGQQLVEEAVTMASGRIGAGQEARAGSGRLLAPEVGSDRCPACEGPLERDAKFCSGCGATIHTGEIASPPLPDGVSFDEEVVVPHDLAAEPPFDPDTDDAPFNRTGPIPIVREPIVREPAAIDPWLAWAPAVAAGFALFAVLMALLVHVFGPSSLPGYSPAEVSLKVQMRAVEWLLAGVVAAGIGMIAKR